MKKTNNTLVYTNRKVKHQYNKYVKHLQTKFGKTNVSSIRKDDIQKLRQSLQAQEKAESTINGIIQLLVPKSTTPSNKKSQRLLIPA